MEIATADAKHDGGDESSSYAVTNQNEEYGMASEITPVSTATLTPTKSNAATENIIEHASPCPNDASEIFSGNLTLFGSKTDTGNDSKHVYENTSDAVAISSNQSAQKKGKMKNPEDYKEYWCSYCGKHFNHKGNMQQHERSHTKERPFSCNLCGVAYTKSSHLLEHRKKHFHTDRVGMGSQHVCTLCSRSFHSKNSLSIHLRSHSDVFNFSCDKCYKKFRHKSSFNRHLRIHAGNKNFACDYCQKTFYDGSDLRKHMAVHTGFKKYECTTCKKRFKSSHKLKMHLKIHISHNSPNNNTDETYDRNCHSESNTDNCEDGISCKFVKIPENKAKESLKVDSVINVMHTRESSRDSIEADEIIMHPEDKNMQTEDKFENIQQDKNVCDVTEKSALNKEYDKCDNDNHLKHVKGFVGYAKESVDNETNIVLRTERENEISLEENAHEKPSEQLVMENIVSLNNDVKGNVPDYRQKMFVASTIPRNEYMKGIKTEDRLATIEIKQEVEDTDSTMHNEAARNNTAVLTKSTDTAVSVQKEALDTCVTAENAVLETNITMKNQVRKTAVNIQKEIVETDGVSSCSSTGDGIKSVMESSQLKSQVTNDTKCIVEALNYQTGETREARPEVHGKVQLNSSLAPTSLCNMPEGKTVIDENDNDIGDAKTEDKSQVDGVLPFRKEDLEVSQTEYVKLTEVYWKTYKGDKTVASSQKMFRIDHKIQENVSGNVRSISKYCVIRPKTQNNTITPVYGVNENPVAYSIDTPVTKEARSTAIETYPVSRSKCNEEKVKSQNYGKSQNNAIFKPHVSMKYCYIKPKPISIAEIAAVHYQQRNIRKKQNILSRKYKVKVPKKSRIKVSKLTDGSENTNSSDNSCQILGVTDKKVGEDFGDSQITSNDTGTGIQKNVPPVKTCRHCRKSFDCRDEFLQHLREHMRPKEFTCDDCKQSFSKWRDYSRHKCSDVKRRYDFICAHCDRVFDTEKMLTNHMNCKKKTCPNCDKAFCTAEELNRHKKTHLIACNICLKKFETRWSLAMHVSKVHTTLKYDHCNKSFMYTYNPKRDKEKLHTNVWFKCDGCDVKFISNDSYTKHKDVCTKANYRIKEVDKSDELVVEDLNSVENELHQIDKETIAEDHMEVNEKMGNQKVMEHEDPIELQKGAETTAGTTIYSIKETGNLNEEIQTAADICDHKRLSENDELTAAVASISSTTEADEVTDVIRKASSFQTEGQSPQKYEDNALAANSTNVRNQKHKSDTNSQNNAEMLPGVEHDRYIKTEAVSDTENEELDKTNSTEIDEGHFQNETLMETNKLVISNALFRKKDKKSKFTFKNMVGNRLMKKSLKENDNFETGNNSELEETPKRTNTLKNVLGNMKNNMQEIARKMKNIRSSAVAENPLISCDESVNNNVGNLEKRSEDVGENLIPRLTVEHGNNEKTNQMIRNESTDDGEVIILDSDSEEDTRCHETLSKKLEHNDITIDEIEGKSVLSDSGSEFLEDDGNYVEEAVTNEDLNKETVDHIKQENSNKKETHLTDKARINKEERIFSEMAVSNKSIITKNASCNNYDTYARNTGHYNTRKRRSETNISIKPAVKLKKVEIIVKDIYKTDNKKVNKIANGFNIDNKKSKVTASDVVKHEKKVEFIASDTSDEISSDSASDEDSEGYEECTVEEVQAMLSSCNKH